MGVAAAENVAGDDKQLMLLYGRVDELHAGAPGRFREGVKCAAGGDEIVIVG